MEPPAWREVPTKHFFFRTRFFMRLSKIIAGFALACAVAAPSIAFAQATSASPSQVQTAVRGALQSAELTPEQKMKIAPMVKQYQAQTANADAATKKSAKEQLLKGIYGVMTPDQQAKFKASLKSSLGGTAP
jgi:hypothetical protein